MMTDADIMVRAAFDAFRHSRQPKPIPSERKNHDHECVQMNKSDGLAYLHDGPVPIGAQRPTPQPPLINDARIVDVHLWVVCEVDVPIAPEICDFARRMDGLREDKIKHSNLTGGSDAYCAGEILFLDESTLVITGRSGRYGPDSEAELSAVATAFRASGYNVWSMGWDAGAGFPAPFIGITPEFVS
jgi:hypothetical protein